MSEELKPCPFCGITPEFNNSEKTFSIQCSGSPDGPFYGDFTSQHVCYVCPSTTNFKSQLKAIDAWNTRKHACPEGLECSGDGSDCVGEYRCKEPDTVSVEGLKIYMADNVETLLSDACIKMRQWQIDHPCRAQVITAKDSVDYWLLCSLIDHLRKQHPNGIKWED